jgi:hypothetical protein
MTGFAIEALSGGGRSLWVAPLPSGSDSFREPMIRSVSLGERRAVLSVFGRDVYLFDPSGREIRHFEMEHPGFTDLAVHPAGEVSELLFASAPGSDRSLYLPNRPGGGRPGRARRREARAYSAISRLSRS